MAHKERMLAAFEGRATQAPPAWEQSVSSDVASAILGRPAHTGSMWLHYHEAVASIQGDAARQEFLEQLEDDVFDLARALGWSGVSYPWMRGIPTRRIDECTFVYGNEEDTDDWVVYRFDPVAATYGPVRYGTPPVWRGEDEIRRKVDAAWESADTWAEEGVPAMRKRVQRWVRRCGEEFEYVGGAAGLAVPLNEEWMIACAIVPDLVGELLKAQTEIGLQQLEVLAQEGVHLANGGGDLASKNGPLYGPHFFRKYVMPCYRRYVDRSNELGIYYIFRSDGDLTSILDDLFSAEGAACPGFGEIDYDAGMQIPVLQARYPRLTCVGNVPCPLLHDGKPDEVRAFAQNLRNQVLPHGRWVAASANTILSGTPVENVWAMYEGVGLL